MRNLHPGIVVGLALVSCVGVDRSASSPRREWLS